MTLVRAVWAVAALRILVVGALASAALAAPEPGQIVHEWSVTGPSLPSGVSYYQADGPAQRGEASCAPGERYPEGVGAVAVRVAASPGQPSSAIQLNYVTSLAVGKGGRYQVSFWAKASAPTELDAAVIRDGAPYNALGTTARQHLRLTPAWQSFDIAFAADFDIPADEHIRAPHFGLGQVAPGTTVWIAGVALAELAPPPPPLPILASGELLANASFADGLHGWTAQAAGIAPSTDAVLGRPVCRVTKRTERWGTPVQDIRAALVEHGPGFYEFGARVRQVQGRGQVFAVVHYRDATGDHWLTTPIRGLGDATYTAVSACRFLTWTGALQAADIGVQTDSGNRADILVAEGTLRALDNLAHGRPVTASSGPAALAVDGDLASAWQADGAAPPWLEVDLGRRVSFNAAVLSEQGARTQAYALDAWDGPRWQTFFTGGSILGGCDRIHFAPVTASRVRLRLTNTSGPPALRELGLYATPIREVTLRVPAPPIDPARRGPRTLVGAIRWDGWCGDRSRVGLDLERVMAPERYHYRLPFYARILAPGQVQIRCTSQEVMDREIAYAKEAGIDYWAFDWYPPQDGLSTARSLYLSSAHRADVNWCVILNTGSFSADDRRWLGQRFAEPNYQKVLGDRPLVYVFSATRQSAQFVKSLREDAAAQSRALPFIVYMGWGPATAEVAVTGGADAIGAYVNPFAQGVPFSRNREHEHKQWAALQATGMQMVPTVTTGWDPRPFVGTNVSWYPGATEGGWVAPATPDEVAAQLRDALQFVSDHPTATLANSVLIYAWNENAEGGWLVPTLFELRDGGVPSRLDAVRGVLRPAVARGSGWSALGANAP